MDERELLLQSLKVYLEELKQSGVDELAFGTDAPAAAVVPAPLAQTPDDASLTGVGNARARLLFVMSGAGFAGPSGELLAKIINAMGFAAEDVFLLSFASAAESPSQASLLSRIAAVAPEIVVALGETAAQLLLQSGESISTLRGRFFTLDEIPLMVTLHPDQLEADPALKREVWTDMQLVMRRLPQSH